MNATTQNTNQPPLTAEQIKALCGLSSHAFLKLLGETPSDSAVQVRKKSVPAWSIDRLPPLLGAHVRAVLDRLAGRPVAQVLTDEPRRRRNYKLRCDSKLGRLPLDIKQQIQRWLVEEGLSYLETRERLRSVFKIHVSDGTLAKFFQKWVVPELNAKRSAKPVCEILIRPLDDGEVKIQILQPALEPPRA